MEAIQDRNLYFVGGPGDRDDAVNVVLTITDGVPFPPELEAPALDLAQKAQDQGILMFAVGITNAIQADVLQALSSQPRRLGQNYFESATFDALDSISDTVAVQACRGAEATAPPPGMNFNFIFSG